MTPERFPVFENA